MALLTREAFRSAFQLGDPIPFARKKGSLKVIEFTDRGMRVSSTQRTEGYLLDFDKLGIVVKDFASIPEESAHSGVGAVLKRNGLVETSTETILYAAAKEFLARSALPRASRNSFASDTVTDAMNRVADDVDTASDQLVSASALRTLRDSEW